jgi:hypothetical protein
MIGLAQHMLLSKLTTEATRQDWSVVDLVVRSYSPGSDTESQLDWNQAIDALGDALTFQKQPPAIAADDPSWLRKPPTKSDVTDFPELTNHAQ